MHKILLTTCSMFSDQGTPATIALKASYIESMHVSAMHFSKAKLAGMTMALALPVP